MSRSENIEQSNDEDCGGRKFFGVWHAEILKCRQSANRRRYQIIGDKEECTDDGNDLAAMTHAGVDTTAVRVQAADHHVIQADQRGQHAHRGDQPERSVTSNGEGQTDYVGLARAPVAVQNRRRALPIDIARSLNVGWYQLIRLKRGGLARRGASLQAESDLRHPLHFNDADEVSCRAGAIKCSRCRAPFAPILSELVPPLTRSSRIIKRNKELAEI